MKFKTMEIIKTENKIIKLKMDYLYSAMTVVCDNGWISIVQMRVLEMTNTVFASEFKLKYSLSKTFLHDFSRYESLEEKVMVEAMARSVNVEPDVIRKMVHYYLQGHCFVSGSIVVSAVVGEIPYNKADIDLFVQCPLGEEDFEQFMKTIKDLIVEHLQPAGFEISTNLYGPDLEEELRQINDAHDSEGFKFKEQNVRLCSWRDQVHSTKEEDYNFTNLLHIVTLTKTENIEGRK